MDGARCQPADTAASSLESRLVPTADPDCVVNAKGECGNTYVTTPTERHTSRTVIPVLTAQAARFADSTWDPSVFARQMKWMDGCSNKSSSNPLHNVLPTMRLQPQAQQRHTTTLWHSKKTKAMTRHLKTSTTGANFVTMSTTQTATKSGHNSHQGIANGPLKRDPCRLATPSIQEYSTR